MSKLMVIIAAILIPFTANGQGVPIAVGVELVPTWQRTELNFRDGQLNLINKSIQFNISTLAVSKDRWRAKYTLLPQLAVEEYVTNPKSLIVGSTDFSSTDTGTATASQTEKLVAINWKVPIGHRFELSPDWRARPVLIGEIAGLSLEATGENKDKQIVTDSETYKRFCVAVGGAWAYASVDTRCEVIGAIGDSYQWVEGVVMRRLFQDCSVGVGATYKQIRFPNDTTIRQSGPFGFLSISF